MKPQQRVVTAQDVESSLYYLHVDSADDEEIREALQATQEAKRLSGIGEYDLRHSTESAGLKRKPLPMSPQLALGTRPEVPPKVYPRFQIPDYQSRELSKFARKPLPSPTQEPPVLDAIPPLHLRKLPSPTQGPPVMDTTSQLPARKPLGPRPLHLRNSYSDTTESIAEYPAQNEGKQVSEQERASDFSITIIRRDPTSGGQWNVGKLTAGAAAMRRKSSLGSSGLQTPQADHSVSIEISTEGYNRFIDYSATHSTPEPNQNSHSHSGLDTLRSEKFPSYSTKRLVFRRQLLLETPRTHSTNQPHRKNGIRSSLDSRSSERSTLDNTLTPPTQSANCALTSRVPRSSPSPLLTASAHPFPLRIPNALLSRYRHRHIAVRSRSMGGYRSLEKAGRRRRSSRIGWIYRWGGSRRVGGCGGSRRSWGS